MAYDVHQLLAMSKEDLDALFAKSPAGPIPNGEAEGTAIIAPGSSISPEIAKFINIFGWQGKTFDAAKGVLRNRISIFGFSAILARVYEGNSLYDQKPCIVLDYSETSVVAHYVRDEIRLIAPNTYLGRVYWDDKPLIHFALQF